jgi:hypothetical protein
MDIITERRLRALEETLSLLEVTRAEHERRLAAAVGGAAQPDDGKMRFKIEVLTPIEQYRSEYFQLLAASADETRIPAQTAEAAAAEVIRIIDHLETLPADRRFADADAFQNLLATLRDMRARLAAPERTAAAKLKAELTRLPALVKYEAETDAHDALNSLKRLSRASAVPFQATNPLPPRRPRMEPRRRGCFRFLRATNFSPVAKMRWLRCTGGCSRAARRRRGRPCAAWAASARRISLWNTPTATSATIRSRCGAPPEVPRRWPTDSPRSRPNSDFHPNSIRRKWSRTFAAGWRTIPAGC